MWSFLSWLFFLFHLALSYEHISPILMSFKMCLSNRYCKLSPENCSNLRHAQTCSITFTQLFSQSQPHFHCLQKLDNPCYLFPGGRDEQQWGNAWELLFLPVRKVLCMYRLLYHTGSLLSQRWGEGRTTFFSTISPCTLSLWAYGSAFYTMGLSHKHTAALCLCSYRKYLWLQKQPFSMIWLVCYEHTDNIGSTQ